MKKRSLLMAASLVLALLVATTGTLAYLSDVDSDVNVMTLGNVKIEQVEMQRAEGVSHIHTAKDGDLVPFKEGQPLYPAYPVNGLATDYSAELATSDLFFWGPYVYTGTAGNGLWNDNNLIGALDKMVFIKNTGSSETYFRTWLAFECPEGMEYSVGPDKEFMMNVNAASYTWKEVGYITIEGVRYWVECATYKNALPVGATSHPSLLQVVMTHNADNDDMAKLGGTYEILAFTEATQTNNFPNAETALNVAFYVPSVDNHPWKDGFSVEDNTADLHISTVADLQAFAKEVNSGNTYAGKTVVLGANLDLKGVKWTPIGNVTSYPGITFAGTFDGQGYTISNLTTSDNLPNHATAGLFGSLTGTVKNVTLKNVNISSTHYAGGIVGYISTGTGSGKVINCHVIGGTISSTPELINGNYDNGDKVGGIVGHITKNDSVQNCSVSGVTLKGYRDVGGIAGYAQPASIQNCTVYGNVIKQDLTHNYKNINAGDRIGQIIGYDGSKSYDNLGGSSVAVGVDSAAALGAAATEGKNVVLTDDITNAPVNTTAPYGNKYGIAQNGGTIDGNGYTLDFDASTGDHYGIMTSGGTIKNMTVTGVFRGIVIMNPTEDVIIENVVVGDEDMCYSINTAEGDGKHDLIVKNSTIKGWNSYGTAIKSVSFTDCTFAQGEYYTNVFGRLVRPYVNTVFEGCEFNSKYYIDLSAFEGTTVVLSNCTVNGVKLTADNWKSLIVAEGDCGEGQISIEGKDGSYMSSSNVFDYVVIK